MNDEAVELMKVLVSLARTLEFVLCPQSWWLDCDSGCWHMSTPQMVSFGDDVVAREDGAETKARSGAAWTAVVKGAKNVQLCPEPRTTSRNRFAVLSDEDMSCEEADAVSVCGDEPLVNKLVSKKVRVRPGLTGKVAAHAKRAALPDEGSSSGCIGDGGALADDAAIGKRRMMHVVSEVGGQARGVLPDEGSCSSGFGEVVKDVRVAETRTDAKSLMAEGCDRDGGVELTHDEDAAFQADVAAYVAKHARGG
jgi:hypothetical protein